MVFIWVILKIGKNGSSRKLPNVAQQKDQQPKEAKPIKVLGNGSHKQSKGKWVYYNMSRYRYMGLKY